jgi:multidrug efflux pump subunit AcrA (membrane-fusion protein)
MPGADATRAVAPQTATVHPRRSTGVLLSVLVRVAVCAGLLLGSMAIFIWLTATRPILSGGSERDAGQRVLVFEPRTVPVRRQWSGFGTATALESSAVPARVSSTVAERPPGIRAGVTVRAGDLLVQLDDSDFRRQAESSAGAIAELDAQLARLEVEAAAWTQRVRLAEEDRAIAAADLERVRRAAEAQAAQVREVESAQQRLLAAERQVIAAREERDKVPSRRIGLIALRDAQISQKRLAEQSIERSRVTTPIDGVLTDVDVELGESVAPGQRIARVIGVERIEVPLRVPASARPDLAVGDEVIIREEGRAGGGGAPTWRATIDRIAPDDDDATRTMTLFAVLIQEADSSVLLPAGRFVEGVAISSRTAQRQVLPRRSIRGDRIAVVRDERLERLEVYPDFNLRLALPELGLPDQDWVVLRDPLPSGTLVLVDGSRSPMVGTRIAPIRAESLFTPPGSPTPPAEESRGRESSGGAGAEPRT